jgi:hypothetical protein
MTKMEMAMMARVRSVLEAKRSTSLEKALRPRDDHRAAGDVGRIVKQDEEVCIPIGS